MNNKRDERENSLNRKKLRFAQKHEKKKHYHIARPAVPGQQPEPEDTALSAALETLVGGHRDTMRRFTSDGKRDNAHDYDTAPDTEKHRQMQKARFIQQQLTQEEHRTSPADTDDYVTSESTLHYDNRDEYSAGKQAYSDNDYGNDTYASVQESLKEEKASEQQSPDHTHRLTETEKAVIESTPTMAVDPETIDRMRKAQYLKEQLERQSVRSAAVEYYDDHTDESHHNDTHKEPKTDKTEPHNTDDQSDIIHVIPDAVSAISDDLKADIQRSIKQKHYEQQHQNERTPSNTDNKDVYVSGVNHNDDKQQDSNSDGVFESIGTAAGYVKTVQSGQIHQIATKPITDTVKKSLSSTEQMTVDGATTITSSVQGADSIQEVPFNIGMVLAENEAKKLAYKMAKGEDILAEKEQAHVRERMEQSKYRFVEPEKHKPKVEKRDTIREEQKRKFVKDSEIKKQAARKEAEQKAKEGIFIKANKREDGLIGKIFGEDKKYHSKGKSAVIAGAASAVIPVILLVVIVMFICALFSWMTPHKEKLFDAIEDKYKENDLKTEQEVLRGYIQLIDEIFEEEQLKVLEVVDKNFGGFDPDDYQYDYISDDERNKGEINVLTVYVEAILQTRRWGVRGDTSFDSGDQNFPRTMPVAIVYEEYVKMDPVTGMPMLCKKSEATSIRRRIIYSRDNDIAERLKNSGIEAVTKEDRQKWADVFLQENRDYAKLMEHPEYEVNPITKDTPGGTVVVGTSYSSRAAQPPRCLVSQREATENEILFHGNDIWDLYQYENKWIRLGNSFDYEYIIAIAAGRKFQQIENDDSIDFDDYIYNLTREDFETVIGNVYSASYEMSPNQICPEENCCMHEDGPFHSWDRFPDGHVILKGRVVNFTEMDMEEASYTYILNKSLDKSLDTFESDKEVCNAYVDYIRQRLSEDGKTPSHTVVPDWANDPAAMAKLIARYEYETGNTYQQWLIDEGIIDEKYFEQLREERKELLKNSDRFGSAKETGDEE